MTSIFADIDLSTFWAQSQWADKEYVEDAPTQEMIRSVEEELGYKLPAAYIELMKTQNGGKPANDSYRTNVRTSWSDDHVSVTGIKGIGREKTWSLCGNLGSQQLIDEWGYPAIGVYFGDCPSAGHDMLCLDFRACGPNGEPSVVHVDQEFDYKITFLAEKFEAFVRGLEPSEAFDDEDVIDGAPKPMVSAEAPPMQRPWWRFWR